MWARAMTSLGCAVRRRGRGIVVVPRFCRRLSEFHGLDMMLTAPVWYAAARFSAHVFGGATADGWLIASSNSVSISSVEVNSWKAHRP